MAVASTLLVQFSPATMVCFLDSIGMCNIDSAGPAAMKVTKLTVLIVYSCFCMGNMIGTSSTFYFLLALV